MIDNVCTGSTHWYRQNINPLQPRPIGINILHYRQLETLDHSAESRVNQFRDALRDLDIVIARPAWLGLKQ